VGLWEATSRSGLESQKARLTLSSSSRTHWNRKPHDADVKALLRIAVVWNIPVACNRASADFIVSSPLMSTVYERLVPDYSKYRSRLATSGVDGDELPVWTQLKDMRLAPGTLQGNCRLYGEGSNQVDLKGLMDGRLAMQYQ